MAKLPVSNSWVKVEPPLFCNGPSDGLVLFWSPVPFRKALASSLLKL